MPNAVGATPGTIGYSEKEF